MFKLKESINLGSSFIIRDIAIIESDNLLDIYCETEFDNRWDYFIEEWFDNGLLRTLNCSVLDIYTKDNLPKTLNPFSEEDNN